MARKKVPVVISLKAKDGAACKAKHIDRKLDIDTIKDSIDIEFPGMHRANIIQECMNDIGAELRNCRRGQKLSQDALAKASGISKATISRIEAGLLPSGPRLLTIAVLMYHCGKRLCFGASEISRLRVVRSHSQLAVGD